MPRFTRVVDAPRRPGARAPASSMTLPVSSRLPSSTRTISPAISLRSKTRSSRSTSSGRFFASLKQGATTESVGRLHARGALPASSARVRARPSSRRVRGAKPRRSAAMRAMSATRHVPAVQSAGGRLERQRARHAHHPVERARGCSVAVPGADVEHLARARAPWRAASRPPRRPRRRSRAPGAPSPADDGRLAREQALEVLHDHRLVAQAGILPRPVHEEVAETAGAGPPPRATAGAAGARPASFEMP